ncbi:MAG: hypothetical protein ACK55I_35395, partial [bacterium]
PRQRLTRSHVRSQHDLTVDAAQGEVNRPQDRERIRAASREVRQHALDVPLRGLIHSRTQVRSQRPQHRRDAFTVLTGVTDDTCEQPDLRTAVAVEEVPAGLLDPIDH